MDNEVKPFSMNFKVDTKMLSLVYICFEYKFPLSIMLSFYELYGDNSIFALKALTCVRKIKLTDAGLSRIFEESRILYKQIVSGISTKLKIERLTLNNKDNEEIPEPPQLDLTKFSDDYRSFIEYYLLPNVDDIFSNDITLKMSTDDIYKELMA